MTQYCQRHVGSDGERDVVHMHSEHRLLVLELHIHQHAANIEIVQVLLFIRLMFAIFLRIVVVATLSMAVEDHAVGGNGFEV